MADVKCDTCHKSFSRKPSKILRAKYHFCSRECVNASKVAQGINRGEKNGNWKGVGKFITTRGYRKIISKGHPRADKDGYVFEHIRVIEIAIGRYLNEGEVVHHINKNKLDNRIENLRLFSTHSEHMKHHVALRRIYAK